MSETYASYTDAMAGVTALAKYLQQAAGHDPAFVLRLCKVLPRKMEAHFARRTPGLFSTSAATRRRAGAKLKVVSKDPA